MGLARSMDLLVHRQFRWWAQVHLFEKARLYFCFLMLEHFQYFDTFVDGALSSEFSLQLLLFVVRVIQHVFDLPDKVRPSGLGMWRVVVSRFLVELGVYSVIPSSATWLLEER